MHLQTFSDIEQKNSCNKINCSVWLILTGYFAIKGWQKFKFGTSILGSIFNQICIVKVVRN